VYLNMLLQGELILDCKKGEKRRGTGGKAKGRRFKNIKKKGGVKKTSYGDLRVKKREGYKHPQL